MSILKNDQKFVVTSVLLHGILALTLAFAGAKPNVPFGVARSGATIVEFSVSNLMPQSISSPAKTKVPSVISEAADTFTTSQVDKKSAATLPVPSSQLLGFTDGARSMAQIGQENGAANTEKDRYLYELRLLIEQKKIYPQISKRLRETGTVVVRFQVLQDGRIEAVNLKSTSSFLRLNEAALGLVRSIEKFRPIPQAMANDQASLEIVLPIEYVLN